jgi:multimeric flavodoxin WrbA
MGSKKRAGCAQEDDMVEIYDLMVDADLTVFTSPVFCWGVSGQLKTLLDRCFALLTGEYLLKDAKWALVLTAGGDHFDGADLAVETLRRLGRFAGVKFVGQHVVANCPDGKALKNNRRLQDEAKAFGKELRKALKD